MNRALFYPAFLFLHLFSLKLFAAAHNSVALHYKKQPPLNFAAFAEVAYEDGKTDANFRVGRLLGQGVATVLSRKIYRGTIFGKTNFMLIKDKNNEMHVAIEGSNDVGNWIANAVMPIRGTITGYDVPEYTRRAMHKIIKHWEKKYKQPIVSISGHSQGGMYASQLVHWKKKHYSKTGTEVITFNCFKPKKEKNQLHFLVAKEHLVSLVSPSGRYIKIDKAGKHTSLKSNHGMKYFFRAFKDKQWDDFR